MRCARLPLFTTHLAVHKHTLELSIVHLHCLCHPGLFELALPVLHSVNVVNMNVIRDSRRGRSIFAPAREMVD